MGQGGRSIVLTPGTCSGEPRVAGTRIRVRTLVDWFKLGASFYELAYQYGLDVTDVENAVRWHMNQGKTRRRRHA